MAPDTIKARERKITGCSESVKLDNQENSAKVYFSAPNPVSASSPFPVTLFTENVNIQLMGIHVNRGGENEEI